MRELLVLLVMLGMYYTYTQLKEEPPRQHVHKRVVVHKTLDTRELQKDVQKDTQKWEKEYMRDK